MLTGRGKLLLSFFCQIVEVVMAIKATIVATKPRIGILDPTSKPKTKAAPIKPKKTPIHCEKPYVFIDKHEKNCKKKPQNDVGSSESETIAIKA